MNRFSLSLLIALFASTSLNAQDSLRLTFKLEGFKAKDQLSISFSEGQFLLPTEKEEVTIVRKLAGPESLAIIYKSRFKSLWIDNNNITVVISKSGFKNGINVQGSPSEDLWQQMVKAPKKERAKILEENINTKMAQSYLASSSNKLFPEDQERLLAMSNPKTNDLAKYNISLLGLDVSERLKEGDPMMDFIASTIDDQQTSTEDLRGKFLLLDFAGTGCGWCWIEYPNMVESLEKYENLQVLTINQDFAHEQWQKRANQRNIDLPWPVLWKAENKKEILAKYGIQVLPTHYLISPEGIILERWQGAKDNKLERVLEKHKVN